MNLVLFLQFYEADHREAMRLARLIASLEVLPREDVEFVFVNRYDCELADVETVAKVVEKFAVSHFTTTTRWTGWPGGCNAMAKDVLEEIWCNIEPNTKWEDARGFLLIEPDCLPVQEDWLNQLIKAWEVARRADKLIMGAWRNSGPPCGHINGNLLLAPQAAAPKYTAGIGPGYAWDCEVTPRMLDRAELTGLIKNCFKMTNATVENLTTQDRGEVAPVLVHGFKDDSSYATALEVLKG